MSSPNAELRRAVLLFGGSIVVLHGIAIGVYYAFGIKSRSDHVQRLFIGVWMGLTLAVVAPGLRRMRRFRGRYRPGGSP